MDYRSFSCSGYLGFDREARFRTVSIENATTSSPLSKPALTIDASKDLPDVMSQKRGHQQTADTANPKQEVGGQLGRIDFLLVHLYRHHLTRNSPDRPTRSAPGFALPWMHFFDLGTRIRLSEVIEPMQAESKPEPGPRQAAEHVAAASQLLKTLQTKIGEHPEIGEAVNKLEMALAILGVQTGGLL